VRHNVSEQMLMLSSTDVPSVVSSRSARVCRRAQMGSRILLACFGLQLFGSACSSTPAIKRSHSPAREDASVAADGGERRSDAGAAQELDAASTDAAARADADVESDAGKPEQPAQARDAASDEGKPKPSEKFDIEAFSEKLAMAVCDSLRDCLGEQKLRAFVDNEACDAHFARSFAQADFGTLHDSVERGRMQLQPKSLDQCYADTRKLGCAIQTERLPASCQVALQGTVEVGDACTIGADCAGQSFCPATDCPRVCTARRAAAGSCTRDEECLSGLICAQGQCTAPAALGEACAGSSNAVCALGTSCVGSSKEQTGSCVANAEVQVGELGAVCTPGGTLCTEGLSCAFDGDQGFNCQEAVASGEECHLALPTQCPASEYCTAEDVTTAGRCAALPSDGEPCVLGSECAGGHVCMNASAGAVVCRRVRDLTEACDADAMCRSGRCAQGKCAASAVCE
jgi:hypothetical protein